MTRSHTPKSLAVLLRARMHPDPIPSPPHAPSPPASPDPSAPPAAAAASVRSWLHASVSAASPSPAALDRFSDGYRSLDRGGRHEILRSLATDYDVPRARVRDLIRQYVSVSATSGEGADEHPGAEKEDSGGGAASALYRMERGLRDALRPKYAGFLEAMNAQPGGLKFLAVIRADLLALLG
jgi:malonyl-CoA decarboxylase